MPNPLSAGTLRRETAGEGYYCIPIASESRGSGSTSASTLRLAAAMPILQSEQGAASGGPRRSTSSLFAISRCRWPVIDPSESRFLNIWDFVTFVLLTITAWLSPFETAFLEPRLDPLFFFDRALDTAFMVDMILQFFIAYTDPLRPTQTVKIPKRIVQHYLGGWFWVDFFSILPIDVYCALSEEKCSQGFMGLRKLKVIRLLRLVRLLRLARFTSLVDRWHTCFGFKYATLSLAKFFAVIFLCCHWMACLWGGLGVSSTADHTWLTALKEAKGGPDELYDGPFQVYGIALYWALISLTSIGYGDVTPQNQFEYWVATFCTSVMAAVWAYVIGAVCSIVSTLEPHEMSFKRTMDDLNWLMSDRKMPHEMCRKLRRYFHETREMNRRRVEREVIDQMSPKLQGEFAFFMHSRWIEKVWYLRNMPHEIIVFMSRNLKMAVYSPNEEVFSDRTLFIVRRGICALSGKILVTGDIWGEDMLLSNDFLRSKNQARSLSYLSVLMLHVEDMVDIVANFPEARARLRWSQVQIAIVRGIQKIAEVTRELDKRGSIKSNQLSDSERMDLFVRILQGRYSAKALGNGDPFGVEPVMPPAIAAQARRNMSCHSLKAHCPSMTSSMSLFDPDSEPRDELDDLRCRVRELTCSLANIGGKVDRLLASSLNSSSRNNLGADLGPLVISQTSFNMNRRTNSSRCLLGNVNNSGSMEKFG
mmetsp:Transcript_49419/g.124462  ORF Transcript_49419/g.124462 Transcript_49419/m.124462 type:complete len:705 (-) Transcript_49419:116-2230(-)